MPSCHATETPPFAHPALVGRGPCYPGAMPLRVRPPIPPMLARLTRELPIGDLTYEPKWDGFRCLAFVSGREVDLRSRHDRPLARYFPELVEGLQALAADASDLVLDGEIILAG